MEQIIILIVIGLLSTLFSKKNKKEPQNQKQQTTERQPMPEHQTRPTSAQPQATRQPHQQEKAPVEQMDPFKRLKELTGDIYREIQEDHQKSVTKEPEYIEPTVIEVPKKKPVIAEPIKVARNRSRDEGRSSGRLSIHNPQATVRRDRHVSARVDITSEQDVLKGIVFSEILGPPKSKQ